MKECKNCGNPFEPKNQQQMYCCEKCRLSARRDTYQRKYLRKCRQKKLEAETNERKKKAEKQNLLAEMNRLAKAAGMSYGQYMAVLRMQRMRGAI